MRRVLLVIVGILVVGIGACTWLLPDRYVVNAPIGQMLWGAGIEAPDSELVDQQMRVADGFELSLWAENVRGARVLRFTPAGDLLVSSPVQNSILLLERDGDGDGRSDGQRVLLEDLNHPYGIDFDDNWLYVGETGGILRAPFDPGQPGPGGGASGARLTGEPKAIVSDLPPGGNHWTRSVRVGPDGWLYVHVGSSCNVCQENDPNRRAALLRMRTDGSNEETFATGLRNSVGFDWQPSTGKLYATDNGRDLLGDDFPPCELNHLERGGFYGFPIANGNRVPDPDFGEVRQRFRHGILQRHQVEPGPGIVGRDEGLDLVSRPSGEPAIDEPAGMGAPGREVVSARRSWIRKKVGPLSGVSHAAQYGVNQAPRPFSRELAGVIHRLRHRRVRRYRSHVEDLIGPETQHLEHLCVERLEAAMHT